jgi:ribosomal protein L15
MTVIGGGGKGKKGKKQRKEKQQDAVEGLNIDFAVIGKFGKVGVSPPVAAEDLDHKIQELEAKQIKYQKDGEK